MTLVITGSYGAALTALFLVLSARVITFRRRNGINLGDGNDPEMLRRMRAQGNFVEYAPLFGRFGWRIDPSTRLDIVASRFELKGDGDYVTVTGTAVAATDGNRAARRPTTAYRGVVPGVPAARTMVWSADQVLTSRPARGDQASMAQPEPPPSATFSVWWWNMATPSSTSGKAAHR